MNDKKKYIVEYKELEQFNKWWDEGEEWTECLSKREIAFEAWLARTKQYEENNKKLFE